MGLTYVNMTPVVNADGDTANWYVFPGDVHYSTVDEGCISPNTPSNADRLICYGNPDHKIEELKIVPTITAGTQGEIREFRLALYYSGGDGTGTPVCTFEIFIGGVQLGESKTISMVTLTYFTRQIFWSADDATPFIYDVADWITAGLAGNIILRMTGVDGPGYVVPELPDFQEE